MKQHLIQYRARFTNGTNSAWFNTPFYATEISNAAVRLFVQADLKVKGVNKEEVSYIQYGDRKCKTCNEGDSPVSHFGFTSCRSKSLASGGFRSHCTCDTCF